MDILLQLVFSGIALGMIYAVIAFGYQLTFATSGTLNFGQGEALMLGALVGLSFVGNIHGGPYINYWLMIPLVLVFGALNGMLVEWIGVRPAIKIKSEFGWIMSTIALAIIFKYVAENIWGKDDLMFPSPLSATPFQVMGANVQPMQVVVVLGALAMMLAVELFNRKSIYGKAVVATSNDRDAAGLMGINTSMVITFSYALSSATAAFAGVLVGLIGPNGSGKSTMMNVLTGIYQPTSGAVEFNGRVISQSTPSAIALGGVARTFQNVQLFGEMTVTENVLVGLHHTFRSTILNVMLHTKRYRDEDHAARVRAASILQFVGRLSLANEEARNLPYGKQRLLEIGRALGLDPQLLLLDEPAAGLTAPDSKELVAIIRKIREHGITVILIEHHQLAGTLPGGEQQTLAMARAVMLNPEVVLLDEPSMGLAPILVDEVFRIIQRLKEQGVTMLLVEQFAAAALNVADYGYVLENGRIAVEGPAEKLKNDPAVKAAYLGGAH